MCDSRQFEFEHCIFFYAQQGTNQKIHALRWAMSLHVTGDYGFPRLLLFYLLFCCCSYWKYSFHVAFVFEFLYVFVASVYKAGLKIVSFKVYRIGLFVWKECPFFSLWRYYLFYFLFKCTIFLVSPLNMFFFSYVTPVWFRSREIS